VSVRRYDVIMKRSCPICEKPVAAQADNGAFPFCSPRCQLIDLGRWLDGDYRVAGEAADVAETGVPSDSSES
jgi:uncharacterized protein